MKKLILLLSIFVLSAVMAFDTSARYRGDLNGDNQVDLADMVYLAKAIKAGSSDKSLDVNISGTVDDYDLQRLADIIISGKLTEDTGMNVGIGGWEDDGEDYGGTVKAPSFTTRAAEDTRLYMRFARSEGDDLYSKEFGIYKCDEMPAAILFNISVPRNMSIDSSNAIKLNQEISATHRVYGTPRLEEEHEGFSWTDKILRFIVFSPELVPLPSHDMGCFYYYIGEDNEIPPKFKNCQIASSGDGRCSDVSEHSSIWSGDWRPIEVSEVWSDTEFISLEVGEDCLVQAYYEPSKAAFWNLVWASSNDSIATVYSEDGRYATVTALMKGEFTITVSAPNGVHASCKGNVSAAVDGLIADDAPCDIYSTDGQLIRKAVPPSELECLPRGLYIIRQRGKTTKLLK